MAMRHTDIVSLVLHGVALPLVSAVVSGPNGRDEDRAIDDASELLSRASEAVRQIDQESALLEKPLSDLDDRMDLLAACCHILANDYIQNSALPDETDLQRHVKSLNALLMARHAAVGDDMSRESGLRMAYLEGYAPLIEAVHSFSFGQSEEKMIQSVSKRIEEAADSITQKVYGDNVNNFAKHHIRSALIALYATCHSKEVKRILSLGDHQKDSETNEKQVEAVWADFELHKEMISIIAETMRKENIPKRDDLEFDELGDIDIDAFIDQNMMIEEPIDFYADPSNDDSKDDEDEGKTSGPMTFFKGR